MRDLLFTGTNMAVMTLRASQGLQPPRLVLISACPYSFILFMVDCIVFIHGKVTKALNYILWLPIQP